MHHSNESHWKPRGVLLNEDRILVMDAQEIRLIPRGPNQPHEKPLSKKDVAQRAGKLSS
jgi:hypothetical protein